MAYGTVNADQIQSSVTGVSLGAGNATNFKNRIINGAMVIDQRNAGASVSATNGAYSLDRWVSTSYDGSAQTGKFTVQQTPSTTETGYATRVAAGFTNYLAVTSSAATTVSSGGLYSIAQFIEGFNSADLAWGTSSAKTVTLSFLVYSSLTGTFGGCLMNSAANYAYPFSYSIPVANTWTTISITVAGPTSGTWIGATNGIGMRVEFSLGTGSTYSGTANAWSANRYESATGTVQVVATSGATFYVTGVQLEVGSSATGFEYNDYGRELILCQRYYEIFTGNYFLSYPLTAAVTSSWAVWYLKQTKRTAPTFALVSGGSWANQTPNIFTTIDNVSFNNGTSYFYTTNTMTASAEL